MRLAVIPGDGIGPEVIDEALKVLDEVAPGTETTTYDLGATRWHSTGELLPETVLTEIQQHDAILLGAVGDPSVPSGILERGLLLRLRLELAHHRNPPRSCAAQSAPRPSRAASSSAACCCGCASSSTTTSTCGPPGSTRACGA